METTLTRIAQMAKERPKERFTTLAHHINIESLAKAHYHQKPRKASGVDGVTKAEYDKRLYENLTGLVDSMKRQAYKPQPARIKVLNRIVETKKVNYVVDVDIKGFFDNVDHEWLMKFVEYRIADTSFLRLIKRFLKAGIMEDGEWRETGQGTPQGGVISPILANLYLHHVLDLWFEHGVKKAYRGEAYLVRYADDFVCCFQYESEATHFYKALKERLAKFNLEIAEDKTKIIKFGRFANEEEKKAQTFNFLGFTHYCSKSLAGKFRVKRRTMNKRVRLSLKRCKEWVKKNRHLHMVEFINRLNQKLRGYYQYYGITDNTPALHRYLANVRRIVFKWLNRRSQKRSFNWDKFKLFLNKWPLIRPCLQVSIFEFDDSLLAIYNGVVKSRVR